MIIEYKKEPEAEPVELGRDGRKRHAIISKSSEESEYKLFYNGGHDGILIPSLIMSTVPLPDQGGGRRNRKSAKRGRCRRRNKTTRRRTTKK